MNPIRTALACTLFLAISAYARAQTPLLGKWVATSATHPAGYLALPKSGKGPGVLVLHAWWGLNDTFKGICDRLARDGFVAFAPDLYHGKVARTIPGAEALGNALDKHYQRARADVRAAEQFLATQTTQPDDIAVIGFSMGGFYALDLGATAPDGVRSVVVFYGTGGPMDFSRSRAAYMGHFASKDPYNSDAEVAALKRMLKKAHRPATFYRYPNTGHWFVEPDVKSAYNKAAAELAWRRTIRFLKRQAGRSARR